MDSNYVAEIQSTCIPKEQLVELAGQHVSFNICVSGHKLLVRDTCCWATCVPDLTHSRQCCNYNLITVTFMQVRIDFGSNFQDSTKPHWNFIYFFRYDPTWRDLIQPKPTRPVDRYDSYLYLSKYINFLGMGQTFCTKTILMKTSLGWM